MAKKDKKVQEEAVKTETAEVGTEDVGTEDAIEVVAVAATDAGPPAPPAEDEEAAATEDEAAPAEGEEIDKKFIGDYTAEQWEALSPADKVAFMKEKAKAAAKRSSGKAPGRTKSGQPTIGGVACDAIREGMTNDEVLTRVFEQFPNAKTSIASITWYRNSLKSGGENIPTSREIKAARAAKDKDGAENAKDPVAGATEVELETELSDEDAAAAAEMAESGELSQDELNELLG